MYALGALGSSEAHVRAATLLGGAPSDEWIGYAYLSGLGKKAAEMPALEGAKYPRMAALFGKLDAAKKTKSKKKTPLSSAEQKRYEHGKKLYLGSAGCAGCHGNQGQGMEHMAPPLDQSEWVTGDKEVLVKVLLHGLTGPIKVAGKRYKLPLVMPGIGQRSDLKDEDLAALLTYIRNFETNDATPVSAKEVAKVRAATKARNQSPYSAGELGK
jgi:mono/diheme cytochrome c family protein